MYAFVAFVVAAENPVLPPGLVIMQPNQIGVNYRNN